jgi:serine/threonine protein kinase
VNDRSTRPEPKDARIEAALAEYLERIEHGEPVDREKFLARHAPIADQLRSFIAADEEVRKLAAAGTPAGPLDESTKSSDAHGQDTIVTPPIDGCATKGGEVELAGQFGRYRIIRALGKGGMGTVYLADDTQMERKVALKTPNFAQDPTGEQKERLFREARTAGNLRHPNICPIHDFGEIEGRPFISMAYIEGRPLSAFVASDPPQTEAWILTLVRKLALALQVAHDQGVIHRDLKPSNVMIDAHAEPIVMDFGLARQMRRAKEDVRLTQSGVLVGSPAYMSPEQIEGDPERIDSRTDQYALGVILYELLTGTAPFRGTLTAVIGQILGKPPEPPSQLRPSLDPRIESVCLRMLSKRPKDRFPSLKAVAEELSTILQDSAPLQRVERMSTRTQPSRLPPARRSRSILAICTAIVVFLILATATIAWFNRLPPAKSIQEDSRAQQSLAAHSSSPATAELASPLRGTIDIVIWEPKNPRRRGLSLADPLALPLHAGDQIKVEASLNRPAYAYVVWIGPDGLARPVYPWRPGDWNLRPPEERTIVTLSLPEPIDEGWAIQGGPGMETLILVARDQPLDPSLPIKDFFASLPAQRLQNDRSLVWFDQGEVSRAQLREPKFFEPSEINDPVLKTQRILTERLKPYFPLIRAVSFANRGP